MAKPYDSKVVALALIFIACCFHYWCQTFMSYDAAYQFYHIIYTDDFMVPAERHSVMLFQLPLVLFSFLENFTIKTYLYGVVYSFVPFVSAVMIYRYSLSMGERYFYYALFSTFVVNMLGFYHILSEHLIAVLFLWPLYGALFCYAKQGQKRDLLVAISLTLFMFYLHPAVVIVYGLVLLLLGWSFKDQLEGKKKYLLLLSVVIVARFTISWMETSNYLQEYDVIEKLQAEFRLMPLNDLDEVDIFFYLTVLVFFYVWSQAKQSVLVQMFFSLSYAMVAVGGIVAFPYLMLRAGISARFFYSLFAGLVVLVYLIKGEQEKHVHFKPQYLAFTFCCVMTFASVVRLWSLARIERTMDKLNMSCYSIASEQRSEMYDVIYSSPHHHWATGYEIAVAKRSSTIDKCLPFWCHEGLQAPIIASSPLALRQNMTCFKTGGKTHE